MSAKLEPRGKQNRSEEGRVGGEGRYRGGPGHLKKKAGIRVLTVTGVQTCALPILRSGPAPDRIGRPMWLCQLSSSQEEIKAAGARPKGLSPPQRHYPRGQTGLPPPCAR